MALLIKNMYMVNTLSTKSMKRVHFLTLHGIPKCTLNRYSNPTWMFVSRMIFSSPKYAFAPLADRVQQSSEPASIAEHSTKRDPGACQVDANMTPTPSKNLELQE